ncbi:MAG: hypothetical protein CVU87_01020 [Firmicutes bacterium HGW-Firmicutes-12]|jgi:hypothetical protein|nr:MAG: hypothetical protein CVU87_01020 [Firmicutes bacterium HGW-Firmicutes-12]
MNKEIEVLRIKISIITVDNRIKLTIKKVLNLSQRLDKLIMIEMRKINNLS